MQISDSTFYSATILERRDLSQDLWVIRVNPGGPYSYRAGQYATLGVSTPEKRYERAYSIVSAPHERFLEFFLELVPQGQLTPRLYECREGDQISLRKTAKGSFTLDLSGERTNHLLIATVTGVAPFVSYIRTLLYEWKAAPIGGGHRLFLLEGASRSWELGYDNEINAVAGEVPWLTYVPTASRPWEEREWAGETGRVDDLIRKYVHAWNLRPGNTIAYLCGNPGMIENGTGILRRGGWPSNAIKSEAFFVPRDKTTDAKG